MKITKKRYILGFLSVTIVLALVRCVFPEVAKVSINDLSEKASEEADEVTVKNLKDNTEGFVGAEIQGDNRLLQGHKDYSETFPDSNAVQLEAANSLGVTPVMNRIDAENRKTDLVFIGSNPYFCVAELTRSIPYLVPKASVLLQDIGRNFIDSLTHKHIKPHKIIVTSVLRSKEDVEKLRQHNRNATENSCHLFGTTFDIAYTHYVPIGENSTIDTEHEVPTECLKGVLGNVLRDLRLQNRCYIKYEVHQACFHITVR